MVDAIISDEEELVRWLLLLMCLSGGDEKNETNRFIVCLGAVIRRGRVGVDVDVTKWLWAVCGCCGLKTGAESIFVIVAVFRQGQSISY